MKHKLEVTKDYSIFENHPLNRPLHDDRLLRRSMMRYGFLPSSPIHCIRKGEKLFVIRGHNRLKLAQELNLDVYYIVDDKVVDIFDLEASFKQTWSLTDFAYARAKAGNKDIQQVIDYAKKHGIGISSSVDLLGGETVGSGNKLNRIKDGSFTMAKDQSYAIVIGSIIDDLRDLGYEFCTQVSFVSAISRVVRVNEFSPDTFLRRLKVSGARIRKRRTVSEYLEEIEEVYNYTAKSSRIPLKFLAESVSKERHMTFGGSRPNRLNQKERKVSMGG